ncbi:MAG TPA: cupin domain-containing protein [Acidimicrobiales bacterium]|nr:cupin domain-containing protein [Acidimicrobiales bacterium]
MSVEESGVPGAFDLAHTFVHLGRGSSATPLSDFAWSTGYLDAYAARFAADGDEGRLVCISPQASTWDTWERHPAGDEVVVLLSGRIDVIQESEGRQRVVELRAGEAMVNPRNVWHTTRVHEPGQALFITPGAGTEHRPLA